MKSRTSLLPGCCRVLFFIVFNSGLFIIPSHGLSHHVYYGFSLLDFSSERSPPPSPHFPSGLLPKFQATKQPEMTEAWEPAARRPGAHPRHPTPTPCVTLAGLQLCPVSPSSSLQGNCLGCPNSLPALQPEHYIKKKNRCHPLNP